MLAAVLTSTEGQEQLRAIVHYLLMVGPRPARETLRRVLYSVASEQQAEELMKTMGEELIEQGHQQGWLKGLDKGRAEGLAEGRAQDVLRILAVRRIPVDERTRTFILSCKDLDTLDRWFDQALSASSLADLFPSG